MSEIHEDFNSVQHRPIQEKNEGSVDVSSSQVNHDASSTEQGHDLLSPLEFSLPPVDGGKDAWMFLAASFVMEALVWGRCKNIMCPR